MTHGQSPKESAELERLLKKQQKLEAELNKVKQELREKSRETGERQGRGRPVRSVVLDALEELNTLAYSREISLYVKARNGQEINQTRFGTLGADEAKAFNSDRNRPVFLCHGLTSERFEAIKRLWGRSDWPLWKRIVAPTTGRVQHLEMTVRLCELAMVAGSAVDPDSLKIVAADHARALPGIKFQRGSFQLEQWRDLAKAELEKWSGQDEEQRRHAAEKLQQLDERVRLFGASEKRLAALPPNEELKAREG